MDASKIVEIAISAAAAIAAVIAIVATYRVARRQEESQRELARSQEEQQRKLKNEQHIISTCLRLTDHLTTWHDALRAAVEKDDLQEFQNFRTSLGRFGQSIEKTATELKNFVRNEEFQGPLEPIVQGLERFPECKDVVSAVRNFEDVALDFKDGRIANLDDMIKGDGHWAETKLTSPDEYRRRKEEDLETIRQSYRAAMLELGKHL